jgi:hypothetical protein
MCKPMLSGN